MCRAARMKPMAALVSAIGHRVWGERRKLSGPPCAPAPVSAPNPGRPDPPASPCRDRGSNRQHPASEEPSPSGLRMSRLASSTRAAPPGEAGEARFDETLPGQAVQHHVDPRRPPVASRISRPNAVERLSNTCSTPSVRRCPCLGRAGGGEHLRARCLGKLYGRQPRPRPHRHGSSTLSARLQPCKLVGQHACHKHRWNGGHRRGRQLRRRGRDQFLPRHRFRPERAQTRSRPRARPRRRRSPRNRSR